MKDKPEITRLEKYFRLINSESDGEALAALRHLIKEATKDGHTWNHFVDNLRAVNFGRPKDQKKATADARANQNRRSNPFGFNPGYGSAEWRAREEERMQKEAARGGTSEYYSEPDTAFKKEQNKRYQEQRAYDQAGPYGFGKWAEEKAQTERAAQEKYAEEEMAARKAAHVESWEGKRRTFTHRRWFFSFDPASEGD